MKSLCIKTNTQDILTFLNNEFTKIDLNNFYIHNRSFKIYDNIILHYTGDNPDLFYERISSVITKSIIQFYERKLLKRIIGYNYFYFNNFEKNQIVDIAEDFIADDIISQEDNFYTVTYAVLDYIKEHHSIVLDGFVNFRLPGYVKNLDYIVDISVNKYITDKEYLEFINILKLYISINASISPIVHLIYCHGEGILLDKDKNIIDMKDDCLTTKYLSDISFSSNDYVLNTLLNLAPKKLVIHLIDSKSDEFIETLKLIFEGRCEICSSCNICNLQSV